jgi:hypothetical protein
MMAFYDEFEKYQHGDICAGWLVLKCYSDVVTKFSHMGLVIMLFRKRSFGIPKEKFENKIYVNIMVDL